MRRKTAVNLLMLFVCLSLVNCASTLKTLNKARDTYNIAVTKSTAAHDAGLIPDAQWDGIVQPALKKAHDAIHDGYKALEDGVSFNLDQLKKGSDPANPTIYDLLVKYSGGIFK